MAKPPTDNAQDRAGSKRISALAELWPFIRPYRLMLAAAFVALTLTAMVSLVLPLAVRRVVDNFEGGTTPLLNQYFSAALIVVGLLALGTGLRYYLVTRLGERVVADIRKAVFDRMVTMSPAFYENIMTGEVLSRITTDTTLILSVIGSSVSVALRNLFIFIGGLFLLFFTSAKLAALVLLIVPVVIVPIVVLGRRLRKLGRENQDWIANSSGSASEALLSVQTVQAFTQEVRTALKFSDVTERSFDSAKRRILTRAMMTVIVIFMIFSGVVGVLWVGAQDVANSIMTVGELVQFVIYAVMVAGAVGALTEIWGELQRAAGATERLAELLNAKDSVADPVSPVAVPDMKNGVIEFSDVTFSYPSRQNLPALNAVNLTVEPGETIALVGPSGAGKSTVIQMLMRFFDPQSGKITLSGVDLRDMRRGDFRQQIAIVPQDAVVFADTARENIRFGRPDATDAEVEAAAKAAAAHDFIVALEKGYDSYLGERGVMLSGGQKQRIAIARAILRDAPILLLDEATSALDAESERLVQSAVEQLAQDRTTLIIAHRLATIKQADRIVVFDDGQIVEQGTHDDLVAKGGLYARLAKLQFTEGSAAA